MDTAPLAPTLATLFGELVDGPPGPAAWMLNPGDAGLLRSLDRLSAAEASATPTGGASVAAHVAHVTYGLSLMNRWAGGEANPFATADWGAAWREGEVDDAGWAARRAALADAAHRWLAALGAPRAVTDVELNGMVASVAHLAYHLGAIRQIAAATRGPREGDG